MKVFVTGGTGLVGSAVVAELIAHGHTVTALARSDASAQSLAEAGAEPVFGTLADLEVLRSAAADVDGVAHLAFSHDFSSAEAIATAAAQESAALAAFGETLIGSDRPLVAASGTPLVAGRPATETDEVPIIEGPLSERGRAVRAVLDLASDGVRSSAVRLPRTVHHEGKGGFAGILVETARRRGIAGYPGDGTQRWPAVHALDAAVVFRLALEAAPGGSSWHAVAEEGIPVHDIVEVVGRRLDLPVEPLPDDAIGPLAAVFSTDCPASSTITREQLGWTPSYPGLLEDLEHLTP